MTTLTKKLELINNSTTLDPTDKHYAGRTAFYKSGLDGWEDYDNILRWFHNEIFEFAYNKLGLRGVDLDWAFMTNFTAQNINRGDDCVRHIYSARFTSEIPSEHAERFEGFMGALERQAMDHFSQRNYFDSVFMSQGDTYNNDKTHTLTFNLERSWTAYFDGE